MTDLTDTAVNRRPITLARMADAIPAINGASGDVTDNPAKTVLPDPPEMS